METEQKPKGGAGRGQGRKAKDGATDLTRVNMMVTQAQKAIVKANGGSGWIRSLIDGANMPHVVPEKPETPQQLPEPQSLQERLDKIGRGHLRGMEALAALQEFESRPAVTTPGGFHVPAKEPVTPRVFGPNDPF